MKKTPKLLTVSLAFAFVMAGCVGTAGSNPFANASSAQEAAIAPNAPPKIDGIAGEYSGTVTDSVVGKGKADFKLSQIIGGQAGGSMQLKFGKIAKVVSAVALDASSMKNINGNAVALSGTAPPCTLTISAKFNRKTYTLTGSYKAFNNCLSGQSGTFSAKELCYYVVAKPIADDLRPRTVPKSC
ncbi:MAG TPA: hypothetical protein VFE36_01940 [Candidatus Baltobacteraceae bacterium]|jgi:hypothetical protein|nr:hypothetical protein [Candidatus Baltobacteraceae bacterium]